MYQWAESVTTKSRADYVHGGTMTFDEYRYKKVWSTQVGNKRVEAGEPQVLRPMCDAQSWAEKTVHRKEAASSNVCGRDVRIKGIYMHFLDMDNRSVTDSEDSVGNGAKNFHAICVMGATAGDVRMSLGTRGSKLFSCLSDPWSRVYLVDVDSPSLELHHLLLLILNLVHFRALPLTLIATPAASAHGRYPTLRQKKCCTSWKTGSEQSIRSVTTTGAVLRMSADDLGRCFVRHDSDMVHSSSDLLSRCHWDGDDSQSSRPLPVDHEQIGLLSTSLRAQRGSDRMHE
eukprot:748221-Hanusia_phi.AAC.2